MEKNTFSFPKNQVYAAAFIFVLGATSLLAIHNTRFWNVGEYYPMIILFAAPMALVPGFTDDSWHNTAIVAMYAGFGVVLGFLDFGDIFVRILNHLPWGEHYRYHRLLTWPKFFCWGTLSALVHNWITGTGSRAVNSVRLDVEE